MIALLAKQLALSCVEAYVGVTSLMVEVGKEVKESHLKEVALAACNNFANDPSAIDDTVIAAYISSKFNIAVTHPNGAISVIESLKYSDKISPLAKVGVLREGISYKTAKDISRVINISRPYHQFNSVNKMMEGKAECVNISKIKCFYSQKNKFHYDQKWKKVSNLMHKAANKFKNERLGLNLSHNKNNEQIEVQIPLKTSVNVDLVSPLYTLSTIYNNKIEDIYNKYQDFFDTEPFYSITALEYNPIESYEYISLYSKNDSIDEPLLDEEKVNIEKASTYLEVHGAKAHKKESLLSKKEKKVITYTKEEKNTLNTNISSHNTSESHPPLSPTPPQAIKHEKKRNMAYEEMEKEMIGSDGLIHEFRVVQRNFDQTDLADKETLTDEYSVTTKPLKPSVKGIKETKVNEEKSSCDKWCIGGWSASGILLLLLVL